MLSRRTVLGRFCGAVIGGSVAIGTTAGGDTVGQHTGQRRTREQAAPGEATTVTAAIDSSVLSRLAMPARFESTVAEFERTTGVSRDAVERITANGTLYGQTLSQGWARATGQFDVDQLRTQLREHDAQFVHVNAAENVLQARETPYTVRLEPTQLTLVMGGTRADRLETLATTARQESVSALTEDAVCHVRLGDGVRERIRTLANGPSTSFETLLDATRSAGVSLSVGPQSSRLRYSVVADPEQVTDSVVTELLDELDAQDGVELVGTDSDVELVDTGTDVEFSDTDTDVNFGDADSVDSDARHIAGTVEIANARLWRIQTLAEENSTGW